MANVGTKIWLAIARNIRLQFRYYPTAQIRQGADRDKRPDPPLSNRRAGLASLQERLEAHSSRLSPLLRNSKPRHDRGFLLLVFMPSS